MSEHPYYYGIEMSDVPTGFGGCTGITIKNKGNTSMEYKVSISNTDFENLSSVDGELTDSLFLSTKNNDIDGIITDEFVFNLGSSPGFNEKNFYVFHKPFSDFNEEVTPTAGEESCRITVKTKSFWEETEDDIIIDVTGNRVLQFPNTETVSEFRGIQDNDTENGYNIGFYWSFLSGLTYTTGFKIEGFINSDLTIPLDDSPFYHSVEQNSQQLLPQYGTYKGLSGVNFYKQINNLPQDSDLYFRISSLDEVGDRSSDYVYPTGYWYDKIPETFSDKTRYSLHPEPGMNFRFKPTLLSIDYNQQKFNPEGGPIFLNDVITRATANLENLEKSPYDLTAYSGIQINFTDVIANGEVIDDGGIMPRKAAAINFSNPNESQVVSNAVQNWTFGTNDDDVFTLVLNFSNCTIVGFQGEGVKVDGYNQNGEVIINERYSEGGPVFDFDFLNYLDSAGKERKFEYLINIDKNTRFVGGQKGGPAYIITDQYNGVIQSYDGDDPRIIDLITSSKNQIKDPLNDKIGYNVELVNSSVEINSLLPYDKDIIPKISLGYIKHEIPQDIDLEFHFSCDNISKEVGEIEKEIVDLKNSQIKLAAFTQSSESSINIDALTVGQNTTLHIDARVEDIPLKQGTSVLVFADNENNFVGTVVQFEDNAYPTAELVVTVTSKSGNGTYSSWKVRVYDPMTIREIYGKKVYEIKGVGHHEGVVEKSTGIVPPVLEHTRPNYANQIQAAITLNTTLKPSYTILVFALAREKMEKAGSFDDPYKTYQKMLTQCNSIHQFVLNEYEEPGAYYVGSPSFSPTNPFYNFFSYDSENNAYSSEGGTGAFKHLNKASFVGSTLNSIGLLVPKYLVPGDGYNEGKPMLSEYQANLGGGNPFVPHNSVREMEIWFFNNPLFWPEKGVNILQDPNNLTSRGKKARSLYGKFADSFVDVGGEKRLTRNNNLYLTNLSSFSDINSFVEIPDINDELDPYKNAYWPPVDVQVVNGGGDDPTSFKTFTLFFVQMHSTYENLSGTSEARSAYLGSHNLAVGNVLQDGLSHKLTNETIINGTKVMNVHNYLEPNKLWGGQSNIVGQPNYGYVSDRRAFRIGLSNNADNDLTNNLNDENTRMFLFDYIHGNAADATKRDAISQKIIDSLVYKYRNIILKTTNNNIQLTNFGPSDKNNIPSSSILGYPIPISHPFLKLYTDQYKS